SAGRLAPAKCVGRSGPKASNERCLAFSSESSLNVFTRASFYYSHGPHLASPNLDDDAFERPRRRAVQYFARLRRESSLVAGALEAILIACVIHRAGQVRALLCVGVKSSVARTYEDRRVIF